MYHSITIGEKNTWDDWHLIAKSRPFFNPPSQKTKYIEVPGSSSVLDLSNALTGYPVFNNREGSIDFTILNLEDVDPEYDYKYSRWIDIYTEMMNYLSGKTLRAVLEDEPEYYYEGSFSVSGYKPGDSASNTRGIITLSYNLGPYKWAVNSTTEDWSWDSFNFENGIILPSKFKDIEVGVEESKTIEFNDIIMAAVRPEITVKDYPVRIGFINNSLGIDIDDREFPVGKSIVDDFVIYGKDFSFNFVGPPEKMPEGDYIVEDGTGRIFVRATGPYQESVQYYYPEQRSELEIGSEGQSELRTYIVFEPASIRSQQMVGYDQETGGFYYYDQYPDDMYTYSTEYDHVYDDHVYVEYIDDSYSKVSIDFKIGRL